MSCRLHIILFRLMAFHYCMPFVNKMLNIFFVRDKFLQEILMNYGCSVGRYLQTGKWFSKILIGPIDSKKDIDPYILTYDFSLISLFHG